MDHWKIFDDVIEEEKIQNEFYEGCFHKLTAKMTE